MKKNTKKALGISIGVIVLIAILLAVVIYRTVNPTDEEGKIKIIKLVAEGKNEECPVILDPYTRMDSVFSKNKTIVYCYTYLNADIDSVKNLQEAKEIDYKSLISFVQADSNNYRSLKKLDCTVRHEMYDVNGKLLYYVEATPSDYVKKEPLIYSLPNR